MSPLILTLLIFCLWPMLIGFIGWQIGRRRLVLRSPIQIHRLAADEDEDEESEVIERQPSALSRLRQQRDVGYKS